MQWLWVEVIAHAIFGILIVMGRKCMNRDFKIIQGYIGWLFLFPLTLVAFSMGSFYFPDSGSDVWQSPKAAFFWFGFVGIVLSPLAIIGFKSLESACWGKSEKVYMPAQQGAEPDAGTGRKLTP
jgi:hypothetical protein